MKLFWIITFGCFLLAQSGAWSTPVPVIEQTTTADSESETVCVKANLDLSSPSSSHSIEEATPVLFNLAFQSFDLVHLADSRNDPANVARHELSYFRNLFPDLISTRAP